MYCWEENPPLPTVNNDYTPGALVYRRGSYSNIYFPIV